MTSIAKRKRSAADDSSDLRDLNARLDRIYSTINPVTPYQLKIPSYNPFILPNSRFPPLRQLWVKGTPFSYDEGELQYISNFREWSSSLIQAVGDWDDGKGGIARISPKIKALAAIPQQAAKRIKLEEYAAKKAERERPTTTFPPKEELRQRRFARAHGMTIGFSSGGGAHKIAPTKPPRKRSADRMEPGSKANGVEGPGEKKARHSPLLEDTRPTLPPPMTPLPENLREALAEYKKQQAEAAQAKSQGDKNPAPDDAAPAEDEQAIDVVKSSKAPQKGAAEKTSVKQFDEAKGEQKEPKKEEKAPQRQQDRPAKSPLNKAESAKELPKIPKKQPKEIAPNKEHPSSQSSAAKPTCLVKLQFRKRRADVARLLKLPARPSSRRPASNSELTSQTPESSSMAVQNQTPRTVSPVANRTAGKVPQSSTAVFAELETSWNTLAKQLKKKSESADLRRSHPHEALVTFITAAIAFMIQAVIKGHYKGAEDKQTQVIWDGSSGAVRRFRNDSGLNRAGCELMECLLWYLEGVMAREGAICRTSVLESQEAMAKMARCFSSSTKLMNPVVLKENFPRTWAGQRTGDAYSADFDQELKKPLKGPYSMTLGMGTALEIARGARLMVIEWCERERVRYDDGLAILGGV